MFRVVKQLKVKLLGMADLGTRRFLSYCSKHRKYYVDIMHTNGEIRCPQCDSVWIRERGLEK